MYHQLMNKESNLKVDKKVSDKKIERLTQKVSQIEKEARNAKETIERLSYENEKMQVELSHLQDMKEMRNQLYQDSLLSPYNGRKTIRGGMQIEITDLSEVTRKSLSFFPNDEL
jgi:peptidoglycan hydrolase CwlO-like protein